jgi:hypothetical protein
MASNNGNGSSFNFDDLLDKSIDDLADLPEFKVPETGIYGLSVKLETKEINNKPAVVCKYTVRNVVELADSSIPEEQHAKAGDGFDEAYILKDNDGKDSEIAWGRLKQFLQPFEVHFGEKLISALVKRLADPVSITAKVTKKPRKDDKEKFSAQVSDITVD